MVKNVVFTFSDANLKHKKASPWRGVKMRAMCCFYKALSFSRSAFSATVRRSMHSWMSPSMKAARL